jgi:hypothetical protein
MPTSYRIPVEETFSWQRPVIDKDLFTPPVSPVTGDRYIVAAVATGAWATHEKDIAWYDGAVWKFDTPTDGWTTYVKDENTEYKFKDTAWFADGSGDMTKAVYDTDNDGIVDKAESVDDGVSVTTAAQVKLAYDSRGVFNSGLGAIIMTLP